MQTSGWSRRQFLNVSGAGLAASACLGHAQAEEAPSSGSLGGTGPAAIDCQSHLYCPEHVALMEKRTTDPIVYRKDGVRIVKMGFWERKILPNHSNVEAKLADMDANHIALAALGRGHANGLDFGRVVGRSGDLIGEAAG